MNIFKRCSYVLLALALPILESCTPQQQGGGGTKTSVPASISGCNSVPDPITLKSGGTVDWTAVDTDYRIIFEPKVNPNTSAPIPVPAPITLPKGVKTSQVLNLPNNCTTRGCYFKYDIATGGVVCNDPGIRVTP